jgi:FkbM family methyltransferase
MHSFVISKLIDAARPLRFRGKYRLFNLIAPTQGIVTANVFGSQFRLDLSEWIQRGIYLGTYERAETTLVLDYLKPGMTVIDVGANSGYYTALAASRVGPGGRIFAIEPNQRPFARLQTLISENRIPASAFNFGVGDVAGESGIYQTPNSTNDTATMVPHPGLDPLARVPIRTLDDCIEEWHLDSVDLVKIDVEGWEPRILKGARRAMQDHRIKAILCEFCEDWLLKVGSSRAALAKIFYDGGYIPHSDDPGLDNYLFTVNEAPSSSRCI